MGKGGGHYHRVSALFPPSTGTDSVPSPAFVGGITAYGRYTKGWLWVVGRFSNLFALAFLVQQIICGRFMFLHRTGPGRSAWDGVRGQTKCANFVAKTQGKTSRSPGDIYLSYIMYQHFDRRWTRGSSLEVAPGVLSVPIRGNGWAHPRMPSISFPVYSS